ncbi:MAG: hypothetical protein D8M26_10945 [Ignavibacteriae bacterium]|nr:hypothetical protein [Ignavibacteriota bacterium]
MYFIKIFLLTFFVSILSSSISFSQWWVNGGNAIWPNGNVSVTKGIFKAYNSYSALAQDNGYHFFGSYQSSLPFSTSRPGGSVNIFEQFDEPINSLMSPLSVYGIYRQKVNSSNLSPTSGSPRGLQLKLVTQFDNKAQSSALASGIEIELNHSGNYSLGYSYGLRITPQLSDTGGVNYLYGIYLNTPWGTGTGLYQNYYAFYSNIQNRDYILNKAYHFYGEGDIPSYFGGAMIQKIYTPDVSSPPIRSELESFFGSAGDVDSGYNFFIDDNGEGHNFYHIVSDGSRWWVFTAAQAP